MENTEKRNLLMDNLKGFLIFCVVLTHICEQLIEGHPRLRYLVFFVYLFHMPCFIYISGYFSKNYSFKKNSKLIYIFIVFGVFYTVIVNLLPDMEYSFSFVRPPWAFWYLISLFMWRTSIAFIKDKKPIGVLVISFVLAILVGCFKNIGYSFSLARTISFLPFFLLGYYSNELTMKKLKNIPKICAHCVIILAVVITILCIKFRWIPLNFQWGVEAYSLMSMSNIKGIIFKIALIIVEIITSIAIINLMIDKETILTKIGRNSMTVFIFHPISILVICSFIKDIYLVKGSIYILIFGIALSLTVLLSSNIVQKIFNFLMKPYKRISEN